MPYFFGVAGAALCTVLLLFSPWDQRLDTTLLVYLALVVASTYIGGLGPGVATAVVAFWLMNHNFLPPVGSLTFTHPGDLMAALLFLGVPGVVSQLLSRSQAEAPIARTRIDALEERVALLEGALQDARDELVRILGHSQGL